MRMFSIYRAFAIRHVRFQADVVELKVGDGVKSDRRRNYEIGLRKMCFNIND